MSNAIEHFSRTRVENTTLQVMADTQRNLARLIHEEESVIRHYIALGSWPHDSVNMFVFEDLQPLVSQIKNAALLSCTVAEDIGRRPMVNIYDAGDPRECTVFVNRRVLKEQGVWTDAVALRALLAHEHAHPLAENATVQAARALSVQIVPENGTSIAAIGAILHLLADRLCVHAPQEVFANEIAIRAGFGDAMLHLDEGLVEKARLGIAKRTALVQGLERQAKDGKLAADQVAALLLVGDLQAHLGFALETAPFIAAGQRHLAEALEARLRAGIWPHLDAAVMPLYERIRDHYRQLRRDLHPSEVKTWAAAALGLLVDALLEKNLHVRIDLVPTRSSTTRPHAPRSGPIAVTDNAFSHDGSSP